MLDDISHSVICRDGCKLPTYSANMNGAFDSRVKRYRPNSKSAVCDLFMLLQRICLHPSSNHCLRQWKEMKSPYGGITYWFIMHFKYGAIIVPRPHQHRF